MTLFHNGGELGNGVGPTFGTFPFSTQAPTDSTDLFNNNSFLALLVFSCIMCVGFSFYVSCSQTCFVSSTRYLLRQPGPCIMVLAWDVWIQNGGSTCAVAPCCSFNSHRFLRSYVYNTFWFVNFLFLFLRDIW
jgi:hypothetical protein